jgi:hypothetical protein
MITSDHRFMSAWPEPLTCTRSSPYCIERTSFMYSKSLS